MAMTRKEFLASAASVGALSACAGTRFWLPRKDSLRVVRPYDEELSWISCNGYQYFSTGISFYGKESVKIETKAIVTARSDRCIFGARESNNNTIKGPNFYNSTIELQWNSTGNTWSSVSINEWHEITINYQSTNPYGLLDGVIKPSVSPSSPLQVSLIPYMFALNFKGSPAWLFCGMCEYYKITVDDVLVADYKPVLKNGIPAMYNSVSNSNHFNEFIGHQFGYMRKNGEIVNPT